MNMARLERTRSKCGARHPVATLLLTLTCAIAFNLAHADSTLVQAVSARAATTGHLDFKIVIPKVLQLNANAGTLFSNAPRTETIVIASTDREARRAIAVRSDPGSIRAAMDTLAREADRRPVHYTVAMP